MSTIAERVAAGAAHLDGREPGWDQRIDLGKLDLHSSCRCVLGQLATDLEDAGEGAGPSWREIVYHFGLQRGMRNDDLIGTDVDLGFNAGGDQTVAEYDALTAEWKRVITERRGSLMTAVGFMTEAMHREALMDLARNWAGYGTTVRTLRLMDLVAGELLEDPCLADFWDTFLGEVALLDGINGEPWAVEVGWADVNDELVGCDRTEAARDEMQMRVAGVLDVLVDGPARKGQRAGV